MKILIYSTPGLAENVFPLVKALQQEKADVTYLLSENRLKSTIFDVKTQVKKGGIIPATDYPELKEFKDYMNMDKVFVANNPYRISKPISSTIAMVKVLWFIYKGKFDVIQTDIVPQYARWLIYFFRKKIVFLQHDPIPHSGANYSFITRLSLFLAHKLMSRFIILNKSQLNEFCQAYNIEPSKVHVNRLGSMDCIKYHLRDKYSERTNNVLFFGSISKYKGIEYLCEAMLKVHKEIPESTVTIAGGKPFYFDITKYKDLPYFEIINRFIEEDEIIKMIQQATICVFPYVDSTQSGCVLTSFTLGKPVIVTDIDTMREMVDDKCAVLIPPRNSEALSDAIIFLLKNPQKVNEMKNYIVTDYYTGERSWHSIAKNYLNFYKSK